MNAPASRRALLASGTAVALAAAPVLASPAAIEPDPIFALIAVERAAWKRIEAAVVLQDEAETPEAETAADALCAQAHADWYEAAAELFGATPTTAAGLVAMTERFEVTNQGCMIGFGESGLAALLATVRAFVSREG